MYWAYSLGGREKECTHNFNVETLGEISISLVTRLQAGRTGFDFRQGGKEMFFSLLL